MYALRIWYAQRQILIKKKEGGRRGSPSLMRYET